MLFDNRVDAGNLISGSSAFSKTGLNIWKFMVHVLLKPGLESFEHITLLAYEMSAVMQYLELTVFYSDIAVIIIAIGILIIAVSSSFQRYSLASALNAVVKPGPFMSPAR